MTVVPLPASPCLRANLKYNGPASTELGSRFYLSYSGSAPTAGNCGTIASDIATAWAANVMDNVFSGYTLVDVDVLDIATDSGASGNAAVSDPGGDSSGYLVDNAAVNVEFGIARRYRGGKPRMFIPPPGTGNQLDGSHWSSAFVSGSTSAIEAAFTAIEAISVGSVGTLLHVSLSYYKGFANLPNSSGRERAVPQYRTAALVDPVETYIVKTVVGSQRRRRISTTY